MQGREKRNGRMGQPVEVSRGEEVPMAQGDRGTQATVTHCHYPYTYPWVERLDLGSCCASPGKCPFCVISALVS
jgi:hypothetical protein